MSANTRTSARLLARATSRTRVVASLGLAPAVALALAACSAPRERPGPAPSQPAPVSTGDAAQSNAKGLDDLLGAWSLDAFSADDAPDPARAIRPVEITFSVDDATGAGRLAGSGGVNRIAGGFDVGAARRNAFKPTPIIATKMAGPPEAMLVEDRVLAALNFATRFRRQGDRLILADNASDLLIFRPAPANQPED